MKNSLPVILFASLLLSAMLLSAAEPETILLWPNGAPGSEGRTNSEQISPPVPAYNYVEITGIHQPTITAYLPAKGKATGVAVIVCPGGAHVFLTWDTEGANVGQWLANHGIAVFALKYRLAHQANSTYKIEVHELADAQRAIRLVRSRAPAWGIRPDRIGIMGFSAGGELAALAANRFDAGLTNAADAVDRVSCRPDFQALFYPIIPKDLVFSKETTPPAFLACGSDDWPDFSEGLPELFLALKRAGVSAELHMYAGTEHGFGLRPKSHAPAGGWPQQFVEWLEHSSYMKKPSAQPSLVSRVGDYQRQ